MRVLLASLLLLLLPLLPLAQDEDAERVADPTAADPEAAPESEIEEAPPATDPDPGPAAPESVRRKRPETDKEEQEYKLKATREDPFLNPPQLGKPGEVAFYNPADWISKEVSYDRSRFLVQNAQGQLLGTYVIAVEPFVSSTGSFIHVAKVPDFDAPYVELWLWADTLKPRNAAKRQAARTVQARPPKGKGKRAPVEDEIEAGALPQQRTVVDYYFDRITVERNVETIGATREFLRQLPYSFDYEQLPLLVRQLDFARLEKQWPFEAFITDVDHMVNNLQLQIDKPRRVDVLTAEPQTRAAFELSMRLGNQQWTWWVERFAPHRLLKFTDGQLTYTLHQYDAGSGSY